MWRFSIRPSPTAEAGNASVRTTWVILLGAALFLALARALSGGIPPMPTGEAAMPPPLPARPDFRDFDDVRAKKQAFFHWLIPYIERANSRIEATRQHIIALRRHDQLDDSQRQWLKDTAARYDVAPVRPANPRFWETLLRRTDVVPISLALAQAANESGWGTSRFARLANNLFGEWCFRKGCGIVPARRQPGQYHEVRRFDSVGDSIRSYLHNLNTHGAFAPFRRQREQLREANKKLDGIELAKGLMLYSGRGQAYVRDIRSMIRHNDLERFDKHSYL